MLHAACQGRVQDDWPDVNEIMQHSESTAVRNANRTASPHTSHTWSRLSQTSACTPRSRCSPSEGLQTRSLRFRASLEAKTMCCCPLCCLPVMTSSTSTHLPGGPRPLQSPRNPLKTPKLLQSHTVGPRCCSRLLRAPAVMHIWHAVMHFWGSFNLIQVLGTARPLLAVLTTCTELCTEANVMPH